MRSSRCLRPPTSGSCSDGSMHPTPGACAAAEGCTRWSSSSRASKPRPGRGSRTSYPSECPTSPPRCSTKLCLSGEVVWGRFQRRLFNEDSPARPRTPLQKRARLVGAARGAGVAAGRALSRWRSPYGSSLGGVGAPKSQGRLFPTGDRLRYAAHALRGGARPMAARGGRVDHGGRLQRPEGARGRYGEACPASLSEPAAGAGEKMDSHQPMVTAGPGDAPPTTRWNRGRGSCFTGTASSSPRCWPASRWLRLGAPCSTCTAAWRRGGRFAAAGS